jgi:biopolymer transport protein ExbD
MILKSPPSINASSMADIAFLLLVFFLVTTTVESDLGIYRKLPPEQKIKEPHKQKERNVLQVYVNKENKILADNQEVDITELRQLAKDFILNTQNRSDWPEIEMKQLPLMGNYPVSKQVISLQTDKSTTYDQYIQVQNELTAAYNELRNQLALNRFGKSMQFLEDTQQKQKLNALKQAIPMRISEAESR